MTIPTKYFLINEGHGLVGGHDYGSMEAAEVAKKDSNIPDAKPIKFDINYLNDCHIHPEKYMNTGARVI